MWLTKRIFELIGVKRRSRDVSPRLADYLEAKAESATDRVFLRVSEKVALGCDDLQWIIYRSRRKEPSPIDVPLKCGRGSEWEAVSFVRSTKEILLRCLGPVTCDEAQEALSGYPPAFAAWKAARTTHIHALAGVFEMDEAAE